VEKKIKHSQNSTEKCDEFHEIRLNFWILGGVICKKAVILMYREKINELLEWKESQNRTPLILRGVRQVGKTWLMKEFGEKHYEKVVYINFENNEPMRMLFEGSLEPERITMIQVL
jgi:predicted AAA+ superfamily ATPase